MAAESATGCAASTRNARLLSRSAALATGDLHPPPGRPVLQDGELVASWAKPADLVPYRIQVRAGQQLDQLAAAYPQQPVHGRRHRLTPRERVKINRRSLSERVPLVPVPAARGGSGHVLHRVPRREHVLLGSHVALELGSEIADSDSELPWRHRLLGGGGPGQHVSGGPQPGMAPGQHGYFLTG